MKQVNEALENYRSLHENRLQLMAEEMKTEKIEVGEIILPLTLAYSLILPTASINAAWESLFSAILSNLFQLNSFCII